MLENEWKPGKPPENNHSSYSSTSDIVEVLLEDGTVDIDFTVNGKWAVYCEKNQQVSHIMKWRSIAKK